MPQREVRRLAREAAEKRKNLPSGTGAGKRLGGAAPRPGQNIRRVIVEAVERRNQTLKGCGTDRLTDSQIRNIADTATQDGFKTQAEEDAANDAAIAQALWELVQEDEMTKYGSSYIPPTAENPTGNGGGSVMAKDAEMGRLQSTEASRSGLGPGRDMPNGYALVEPRAWSCSVCTLQNPPNFLCCDACGSERTVDPSKNSQTGRSRSPKPPTTIDLTQSPPRSRPRATPAPSEQLPKTSAILQGPQAWLCSFCGTEMDRQWWTCSTCGKMKDNSR